jgi:MipA family protein
VPFILLFIVCSCLWAWAPQARAAPDCAGDCAETQVWQFSVSLGLGVVSNPLSGGEDIPIFLVPRISYYGKRFFWDNLDVGYSLLDTPQQQLNLLVTPGYEHLYFHRWSPASTLLQASVVASGRNPVDDSSITEGATPYSQYSLNERHLSALAGLDYTFSSPWGELNLQWLDEISGLHAGQEWRLAWLRSLGSQVRLSLGVNYQSADLLDYYFGISPDEVRATGQPYRISEGALSGLFTLDWRYRLSEDWQLTAKLQYKRLASVIRNSPLVDKDYSSTLFVGGTYHF